MVADSFPILQTIRNRLSTAESGWLAWAEACTQSYDAAYAKHTGALSAAKVAQTARDEDKLKLFNMMLAIAGASWVPRLLQPITSNAGEAFGYDALTTGWVKDALKASGDEAMKSMKGTALAELKRYSGSTYDAFEPVVDTTINYSSRLKEGIYKRAEALLRKMDDVIAEANLYTMLEASQMQNDFLMGCPFLKDLPRDIGDSFKAKFQDDAELAMWVQWALRRDEAYWRKAQAGGIWDPYAVDERHAFDAIRERLRALGVPRDVTVGTFGGQDGHPSTWEPPINMIALITWAKNRSNSAAANLVCRPVSPLALKMRRDRLVSTPEPAP